jgi:Ser/Thr protein kinase RdoA (MazF antagonist)
MRKSLKWVLEPASSPGETVRRISVRALRSAGSALGRMARHLAPHARAEPPESVLFEFHAEAGAPEGALFVNGQRIGTLPGVTRL